MMEYYLEKKYASIETPVTFWSRLEVYKISLSMFREDNVDLCSIVIQIVQ